MPVAVASSDLNGVRTRVNRWQLVKDSWKIVPTRMNMFKIAIGTVIVTYFICTVTMFSTFEASQPSLDLSEQKLPPSHQRPLIRKYKDTEDPQIDHKPWFLQPSYYAQKDGCDFSELVRSFDPKQLDIHCGNIKQLELGEKVGEGFWREVYKANWKDTITGQERHVAVKIVKEKLLDRSDIIPRHIVEAAVMFPIRKEPNIVALIGWCNSTVIVDYIPHALDELIFDDQVEISVERALELALDAAKGLYQLHAAPGGPFAHADLQPRQFLINANGTVRLNDFNRVKYTGPSLLKGEENLKCLFETAVAKGKWRSPEEYASQPLDEKLDIYSLALVLWSLRSRTNPYANIEKTKVNDLVGKGKLRPPVEQMNDYPSDMQRLIIQAWDQEPSKRPSAKEMVERIDKILERYRQDV